MTADENQQAGRKEKYKRNATRPAKHGTHENRKKEAADEQGGVKEASRLEWRSLKVLVVFEQPADSNP
jgi:hypothetical protein